MDNKCLSQDSEEQKRDWLDDLIRDAVLSSSRVDPAKAEKNLKEIKERLAKGKDDGKEI